MAKQDKFDVIAEKLERLIGLIERAVPNAPASGAIRRGRRFRVAGRAHDAVAGRPRQPRRPRPAQGYRPGERDPGREHDGDLPAAMPPTTRCCGAPAAWANRPWSRPCMPPSTPKARPLKLIEIHREDIASLPVLLNLLRGRKERFILFCDDLSFDAHDTSYKSLKAALEGGIEGRPANTILYATSNRRHLLPRDMIENERSTAISPSEAVEEKVSLSDRFGLWLGFHNCSQDDYLAMIDGYCRRYKLKPEASACAPKRSNGQRRAAAARAALPGNSSRTWPDVWESGSTELAQKKGPREEVRAPLSVRSRRTMLRPDSAPDRPAWNGGAVRNAISECRHCRYGPSGREFRRAALRRLA